MILPRAFMVFPSIVPAGAQMLNRRLVPHCWTVHTFVTPVACAVVTAIVIVVVVANELSHAVLST